MRKQLLLSLILILVGVSSFSQDFISGPRVDKAVFFDVSPPLRDMMQQIPGMSDRSWKDGVVPNYFPPLESYGSSNRYNFPDKALQLSFGPLVSDTTIRNFDGLCAGGSVPPDTYGEAGLNCYFQVVNTSFAIYNKSGIKIFGPVANSSVWNGMPYNTNSGDAVVLYDELANRWFFTQFALPNFPNGPFYQMIAVSQTPDPTGSWYRWQYLFADMPDYPKFGVWPDGYYMSCNRFSTGSTYYVGTGAAAFDRTAMLAGNPNAQMIYFTLSSSNEASSLLPSDCDGDFPPTGTPNYFTYIYEGSPQHLGILEFHADWATPANSTLGNLYSLNVNSFDPDLGNGIPQKGTNMTLSTLSDRLMFRQQFRKFNNHWSMVCNHSVDVGSNRAGIRWYELQKSSGAWFVYQQGTYAPADNNSRWMGSIAMDSAGNIGLGYSISGINMFPSIRYTGRLHSDPVNTMTISEKGIINGGGCQMSNSHRWGDYSSMRVDPKFPTTFWYTTEYYSYTGATNWQTRVGSFSFQNVFSTYAAVSPESICEGDSVQLSAIAYGGSGNYTYQWSSIPPGFSSTKKNPKAAPDVDTKYIAAISDGTQTRYDTTAQVDVTPPPSGSAGNDTTVCINLPSIDLHGTAYSYRTIVWGSTGKGHFSDSDSLNTTYFFDANDYAKDSINMMIMIMPLSPCKHKIIRTMHVKFDPCTGIQENETRKLEISVQPNPAHEKTKLTIKGLNNERAFLTILNLQGEKLFSDVIYSNELICTREINISAFTAGMYFIQLKTDTRIKNQQFIVK